MHNEKDFFQTVVVTFRAEFDNYIPQDAYDAAHSEGAVYNVSVDYETLTAATLRAVGNAIVAACECTGVLYHHVGIAVYSRDAGKMLYFPLDKVLDVSLPDDDLDAMTGRMLDNMENSTDFVLFDDLGRVVLSAPTLLKLLLRAYTENFGRDNILNYIRVRTTVNGVDSFERVDTLVEEELGEDRE